ncbi:MAG: hypothetical protein H0X38_05970 [Planctomycetes bacterium]|nr:hypothetical protein [Planctomycetota bacterium]
MSFSMISKVVTAVILSSLATATVVAADASSTAFIGPKGGDTRKGVPTTQADHAPAQGFVVEGDAHAIAKGDSHQGKAFPRWSAPVTLTDRPAVAQDLTRPIGPKGGPTRRGL